MKQSTKSGQKKAKQENILAGSPVQLFFTKHAGVKGFLHVPPGEIELRGISSTRVISSFPSQKLQETDSHWSDYSPTFSANMVMFVKNGLFQECQNWKHSSTQSSENYDFSSAQSSKNTD